MQSEVSRRVSAYNAVHPACFGTAVRRSPDGERHACPERPVRHARTACRVSRTLHRSGNWSRQGRSCVTLHRRRRHAGVPTQQLNPERDDAVANVGWKGLPHDRAVAQREVRLPARRHRRWGARRASKAPPRRHRSSTPADASGCRRRAKSRRPARPPRECALDVERLTVQA